MKRLSLLVLCLSFFVSYAQTTKEQLATQYFRNGEYDKSADLYEELHQNDPKSERHFSALLSSLYQIKDYDRAEKYIRKQLKRSNNYPSVRIELGFLYEQKGEKDKATKEYESALKNIPGDISIASDIAESYKKKDHPEYALKTYLNARKSLGNKFAFSEEIAQLYSLGGNKQGMIEEQLGMLEEESARLPGIQNTLMNYLVERKDYELLRTILLKRINSNPDNVTYSELFIWTMLQMKEYEVALQQVTALDYRLGENGYRLLQFANYCRQNKNFDVAIKAYQKIIEAGKTGQYYPDARVQLLACRKEKIYTGNYSSTDLADLEKDYENYLVEYPGNASATKDLANIKAQYLNKITEAISLLEKLVEKKSGTNQFIAECKLDLGDCYLLNGEIWEAALMYGQVDVVFKDEPLGQMAKFRNAKLSYYTGDFDWSKAQLDVLKASTSQLISNDALNLSLVIADNTGLDTTTEALQYYASADLLIFQHRYVEALAKLDSINLLFPSHALNDEILWSKANISLQKNEVAKSLEYLQQIISEHREDIWADDAAFLSGEIYEKRLMDQQKAMEYYKKIIDEYAGSLNLIEARKRYRTLRGDSL